MSESATGFLGGIYWRGAYSEVGLIRGLMVYISPGKQCVAIDPRVDLLYIGSSQINKTREVKVQGTSIFWSILSRQQLGVGKLQKRAFRARLIA